MAAEIGQHGPDPGVQAHASMRPRRMAAEIKDPNRYGLR